jgi:ActR/RegA family two-component response regulator
MKDEKKSSIIKEAIIDYDAITEAAKIEAKNKLANEFPDNFNKLLKEEINKNKAKESYKKLDDAIEESEESDDVKSNKESDMKNEKETPKSKNEDVKVTSKGVKITNTVGKGDPFDTKPKNVAEDVKITDTVGKSDPFKDKAKTKIEEEREKDFMGDVETKTPNQGKGKLEKGVAFQDKLKGPSSGKPISNLTEDFDITELDLDGALDGAEEDDQLITVDEIEREISEMEGLGEELQGMEGLPRQKGGSPLGRGGDAFTKLVSMRNELDEMIKSMNPEEEEEEEEEVYTPEEEEEEEEEVYTPEEEEEVYTPEEEEEEEEEGFNPMMSEEDVITDDDINAVLGGAQEEGIEEALGISHAANKIESSAHLPGNNYVSPQQLSRRRDAMQESKKLTTLIEENKKLTKKLNESKKANQNVTALVENYKNALEKYRNQLKEMAVFNTNLANVNNLLVNESLALTQDEKIKIINEFKKIDNITESQKKYKSFLSEMKEGKKTITESMENKVSASIQPSSKQIIDEVVEKTAYANDKHIQKMRGLIEYVENRGKKIIK